MGSLPPWVSTFVSAELLFLLVRSADLVAIIKNEHQRLPRERNRVARGLVRALALEFFLFVPASAILLLMIAPAFLPKFLPQATIRTADYAVLGVASYGFPFTAVRGAVSRIALNTLKEFATLAPPESSREHE